MTGGGHAGPEQLPSRRNCAAGCLSRCGAGQVRRRARSLERIGCGCTGAGSRTTPCRCGAGAAPPPPEAEEEGGAASKRPSIVVPSLKTQEPIWKAPAGWEAAGCALNPSLLGRLAVPRTAWSRGTGGGSRAARGLQPKSVRASVSAARALSAAAQSRVTDRCGEISLCATADAGWGASCYLNRHPSSRRTGSTAA